MPPASAFQHHSLSGYDILVPLTANFFHSGTGILAFKKNERGKEYLCTLNVYTVEDDREV
jgi:hypothetical protein